MNASTVQSTRESPATGDVNGQAQDQDQGQHQTQNEDKEQSSKTTVRVAGDPEAKRTLTLHFAGVIEQIGSLPDPGGETALYYGPGLDLLNSLRTEQAHFGSASPTVPESAPIAEQILALTDEAFNRAEEILTATDEESAYHSQVEPNPELSVLLAEMGGLSIRQEINEIRRLSPAPDTNMGCKFY